ncbi:GNAT family N-acetyltransferase [Mobilitalea sibirica]|uniref:GNAT family N-acetyltransferase n=1 Tax=Mobilitalea sibirica TaxID=1462919 RepID=A0A8J7H4T0_9FIRM|nr:GNAT family N-acetyltransferase [Mobilitalea sibirica]MBH1942583.1 GNAT family N-acetyltransferase [Mobilitalea sibirica]
MSNYEFQLANHDDIPEIVSIYYSLIGTPGCTWNMDYPSKETAENDINNDWLYTLKKHDKIIAVASIGDFNELRDLHWKPKKPCELARIGVNPEFQKQGIGTMLLQNIIKTAKEKGYDGIRMLVSKTNSAALALYDKNGFERCGEVFRFDIDFYCYQITF